ncbi:hypothetical protein BDK51DRAFT_44856 [Blyttiomyces helicus]|uniref:SH3 domain-containing protein n=1 Tax=Blyttiomyces helicus TaxID=388810 RepID=A0A4P9WF89_9FUNG|nr:hypothetical protein BDK51DRAFT_44856 [Blyttiomyces helicus]|eukprot:RKO89968.1 hypothetical protein BDK51DRAFT_44856 [Blyttiomyces helicus]
MRRFLLPLAATVLPATFVQAAEGLKFARCIAAVPPGLTLVPNASSFDSCLICPQAIAFWVDPTTTSPANTESVLHCACVQAADLAPIPSITASSCNVLCSNRAYCGGLSSAPGDPPGPVAVWITNNSPPIPAFTAGLGVVPATVTQTGPVVGKTPVVDANSTTTASATATTARTTTTTTTITTSTTTNAPTTTTSVAPMTTSILHLLPPLPTTRTTMSTPALNTTTPANSTSMGSSSNSSDSGSSGLSQGALIGIVVGAVFFWIAIILIVFLVRSMKKKGQLQASDPQWQTAPSLDSARGGGGGGFSQDPMELSNDPRGKYCSPPAEIGYGAGSAGNAAYDGFAGSNGGSYSASNRTAYSPSNSAGYGSSSGAGFGPSSGAGYGPSSSAGFGASSSGGGLSYPADEHAYSGANYASNPSTGMASHSLGGLPSHNNGLNYGLAAGAGALAGAGAVALSAGHRTDSLYDEDSIHPTSSTGANLEIPAGTHLSAAYTDLDDDMDRSSSPAAPSTPGALPLPVLDSDDSSTTTLSRPPPRAASWAGSASLLRGLGSFESLSRGSISSAESSLSPDDRDHADGDPMSIVNSALAAAAVAGTGATVAGSFASSSALSEAGAEPVMYRAHIAYIAGEDDELSLSVGQEILVSITYDDGWALGTIVRTGQVGMFPLMCVSKT